jgi:pilus assembly protein CpaB
MVIGKYAAADFSPGDYILTTKVSDDPTTGYVYLHGLNRTKQAISVTVNSLAAGLSGKLMAGDIVSIIVPDFRKMGVTVTPPELQFVEVIAATASTGYDTNRRAAGGNGAEAQDEKKELHVTITLLASPEQSRLLAELEADSKIHIALVYRGPHDDAAKFLQAQDDVIAGLYAPEEGGDEDA